MTAGTKGVGSKRCALRSSLGYEGWIGLDRGRGNGPVAAIETLRPAPRWEFVEARGLSVLPPLPQPLIATAAATAAASTSSRLIRRLARETSPRSGIRRSGYARAATSGGRGQRRCKSSVIMGSKDRQPPPTAQTAPSTAKNRLGHPTQPSLSHR